MRELVTKNSGSASRAALLRGLAGLALAAGLGGGPVLAQGLSIGLGGLGEVSLGRDSLARADLDVGGVDVEAGVAERGSLARGCVGSCDRDTSGGTGTGGTADRSGGLSVGLSVGGGGIAASVGGGSAGTGTGGGAAPGGGSGGGSGGGPGQGPAGSPGTGQGAAPGAVGSLAVSSPTETGVMPKRRMRCANGGNAQLYNGFALVDRQGTQIGIVHDTWLTPGLDIAALRVRTADNRCLGLQGGSYRVLGNRIRVNMDGARLR